MVRNYWIFFLLITLFSCSSSDEGQSNLIQGEDFLRENILDPTVIQIEAGLQYKVLESGKSGLVPVLNDVINADFHGTLLDGSVFWSSIDNGEPLVIMLSQLIPGCQKAIALMEVGDKWRVYIHPDLAYGKEGRPGIPSNSTLTFDITLHSIDT